MSDVNKKLVPYIVCMDASYIRDAQMVDTRGLSNEEFEEGLFFCNSNNEELWHDIEPIPYIDCVMAESEKQACEIVGNKKRYDHRCLFAIKIRL